MIGNDLVDATTGDSPGGTDPLLLAFSTLPVDGVSISTLASRVGAETVGASTSDAGRWDEIQLDLGEGPIWQAVRTGVPVLEPDLARTAPAPWPTALLALRGAGVGAVFAFPMHIGRMRIGTVGLYAGRPLDLPTRSVSAAAGLARTIAASALDRTVRRAEADRPGAEDPGEYSRREIHQAVGMVAAQTGASPSDALLLLRASAFAAGRRVRDVAVDVLDRLIDFGEPDDLESPERNQP